MYDSIYKIFIEAQVANNLPEEVAFDKAGTIVPIGSNAQFGMTSKTLIMHPEYILFGDKTGINTNQKDNGHQGGTRYLTEPGMIAQYQASTANHCATVLPFTAASGKVVVVAIVFAATSNHNLAIWSAGYNITADPI